MRKQNKKYLTFLIYFNHIKNIIFPEKGFYQGDQNRVVPDPA